MKSMPIGMTNIANNCYLNTCMQCLMSVNSMTRYLKEFDYGESGGDDETHPVARFTAKLMVLLDTVSAGAVLEPKVVKTILTHLSQYTPNYLSLVHGEQHDITELWVWWMDKIHEEYQRLPEGQVSAYVRPPIQFGGDMKNWEPFHKMCLDTWNRFHSKSRDVRWAMLYEGLLIQQVQCPKCRRCFHNPEPVSCLTLDIPEGAVSLADCFKEYFKPETLAEWRCDDCKIDTSAEKLVRFWKAPPVLTIVLKRFKPSADGRMRKNKTPIHIPLEFHFLEDTELYPREGEVKGAPKDYRLVAVANHYGDIHGGHYNATVRRGDAWWNIDDDHVSRIDPRAGGWWDANPRAYVLFYEK